MFKENFDQTVASIGEMTEIAHKLRVQFFKKNFSEAADSHKKILDIGCGGGEYTDILREKGFDVIGCDTLEDSIEFAKKKYPQCNFIKANVNNLPFNENYSDIIICIGIFEYMNDAEVNISLNEIKRVLKKDGLIILMMLSNSSIFYRLGLQKKTGTKKEGSRFNYQDERSRLLNLGYTNIKKRNIYIFPKPLFFLSKLLYLLETINIKLNFLSHVMYIEARKNKK